ncbi:MAG: hypothetical protein ACXWX2_09195 [Actinomycetota bacterium]
MLGNDVMAMERIADRLREAESERRSRPFTELRASARRRRLRAAIGAVRDALAPARHRRTDPVGGR